MADDFRCQVKQIISDFKAAERITGDISVGIVSITHPLWTVVAEELAALLPGGGVPRGGSLTGCGQMPPVPAGISSIWTAEFSATQELSIEPQDQEVQLNSRTMLNLHSKYR